MRKTLECCRRSLLQRAGHKRKVIMERRFSKEDVDGKVVHFQVGLLSLLFNPPE